MCAIKNKSLDNDTELSPEERKQKTCFAIMPIADHPDYPNGHFSRVYNHLIKPACEQAGYKIIRADDAKASHMIIFDILKNIIECDMAICDLSSKNANVFYELGLRQAFNRKTILITDSITNTPFDITGFRYVKYSESLRVDTVQHDVREIAAMLEETESASEDDINSIVNLLKIQPAQINKVQLNEQESVVYELIKNLDAKVSRMYNNERSFYSKSNLGNEFKSFAGLDSVALSPISGKSFNEVIHSHRDLLPTTVFYNGDKIIGKFISRGDAGELIFKYNNEEHHYPDSAFDRANIKVL